VAVVLAAFGALLGLFALARRRGVHPEVTRKGVHVGTGLITLAFPFVFDESWPVLTICGVGFVTLASLRWNALLRGRVGGVIRDVERTSAGELFFPPAVALTYLIAGGDAVLYTVPILILTFADAAAAAFGLRYGKRAYTTGAGRKTTEGSAMFLLVALLATHSVLVLADDTTRAEALLIPPTLGVLAMVLEAVSRWGADNLLVPVGSVLLLKELRGQTQEQLVIALVILTILLGIVLAARRRATLNDAALMGAALCGFVAWAVGGWRWVLPPLTVFVAYPFLAPATFKSRRRVRDFFTVVSITATGGLWLLAAAWLEQPGYLYGYTLGFAAHLAMIVLVRMRHARPDRAAGFCIVLSIAQGWLLLLGPYLLLEGSSPGRVAAVVGGLVAVAAAVLLFNGWQPEIETHPTGRSRWLRQGVVSTLASLPGLIPAFVV
jgi:phytol kinase